MTFTLSSTWMNPYLDASHCNDGNTAGVHPNICNTNSGDKNPTLTIEYFCASGTTRGALSQVRGSIRRRV